MNKSDIKKYFLIKEMVETIDIVRKIDIASITSFSDKIKHKNILLTGEGSSRIFPAKKTIFDSLKDAYQERLITENATQALTYKLKDYSVFASSNSGKTKEVVRLIRELSSNNHKDIFGISASAGTPVMDEPEHSYLLSCGKEEAVSATKSVIEQALFYDILFRHRNKKELPDLNALSDKIEEVLNMQVPTWLIDKVSPESVIYFSGENNGVAEELTLKTNEITRLKSDFLEGTYAVHGIEEVMDKGDLVIVINPIKSEEEKFNEVLVKGVGLTVFAISGDDTIFPSMKIPEYGDFTPYLELAAGWNLLIEIGLKLAVNLDKPVRARKIGNELRG